VIWRPRFRVDGPVVDPVIDAGGPAFEIRICRMASPENELVVAAIDCPRSKASIEFTFLAVTPGTGVHGSFYSYRDVYLDLDPLYKDRFGRPLVRGLPAAMTVCQKSAARKATTIMRRIRPRVSRTQAVSSWEVSRSGSLMRNYSVARQRTNLTRH
jgi:hypothetical protein